MMFQEKNNRPLGSNQFSQPMQRRMEKMQRDADRLFSIGWLRKRLWRELTSIVQTTTATEYADYRSVLRGTYEMRFAWEFLSVCQKSLSQVKRVLENAYDDTDPLQELMIEREKLIFEFASLSQLSSSWECVKDDDDSWRKFARRMPLGDQMKQADITAFFELLDRIALMTDILCGRAAKYGLEVDYSNLEKYKAGERKAKLTDEIIIHAVEDCAAHLHNQSDWTAVHCVLRDDHGMMYASEFEREIAEWKFSKNLPACPEGTITKTQSNHTQLRKPINNWPEKNKFKKIALAFRECLNKRLSEA